MQAIHPFWRTILVEVFRMPKSSGKTQPAPIPSPRLCPCFPIPDPCFSGLQTPKNAETPPPPTPNSSKNRRWNPLNLCRFNELQKPPIYPLVNTNPHFQAKKHQKHRRNWHFRAKMALLHVEIRLPKPSQLALFFHLDSPRKSISLTRSRACRSKCVCPGHNPHPWDARSRTL